MTKYSGRIPCGVLPFFLKGLNMKDYELKDMDGFAKTIGLHVAETVGIPRKQLKQYIKVFNIKEISKQYCTEENGRYYIDDQSVDDIVQDVTNWVVGIDLAKLAASDKLECYWEDDINEMVFQTVDKVEKK